MKKLSLFFMIAAVASVLISCGEGYGTKLEEGSFELYYTDEVTEKEAQALIDFLKESGETDGDETKTCQLTKEDDVYQVRLVIKESYLDDEEYAEIAANYAYTISQEVFDGEDVEIHLCDEELKTIKVVEMDKGAGGDKEMEMLEFDGTQIEYDNSVTKSQVNDLGNYLIEGGFTDGNTKSIQFVFEHGVYVMRMVVSEETSNDAEYEEIARGFAYAMSTDLFDGDPVEIQLCDKYFLPYTYISTDY